MEKRIDKIRKDIKELKKNVKIFLQILRLKLDKNNVKCNQNENKRKTKKNIKNLQNKLEKEIKLHRWYRSIYGLQDKVNANGVNPASRLLTKKPIKISSSNLTHIPNPTFRLQSHWCPLMKDHETADEHFFINLVSSKTHYKNDKKRQLSI